MPSEVTITVLAENYVAKRGLLAEHGLSLWIETDGRRILFDTGQGIVLAHNAAELGIDLSTATDVVISHGHYDHSGGLYRHLERFGASCIHVHPDTFRRRFSRDSEGQVRGIGSPIEELNWLQSRVGKVRVVQGAAELAPGVWLLNEIPRRAELEDTGGAFFLDAGCTQPDPFVDEQVLAIDVREGLVVIAGCAHTGVCNSLRHVLRVTGRDRVRALVGGMHLLNASPERLEYTRHFLRELKLKRLIPAHCTGRVATQQLWTCFPGACADCSVGARWTFE